MSDTKAEYIEVNRILSDIDKNNTKSEPESIDINDIKSFRGWHKGGKDTAIKGEMTLIVLKPKKNADDSKVQTMLIEESYKSFIGRMSTRVVIHRLEA